MKILVVLTYYRPHTSGLTIYAERLSKALVSRGHTVTVLTSQFDPATPVEEVVNGVQIIRVPVLAHLSKGVIMPKFGLMATRLVRDHDVVHLHLPQFDAAGVALRARLWRKPVVITYHCDLELPSGLFNRMANLVIHVMNRLAAIFTNRFVAYTRDFAEHSPYLSAHDNKISIISPPVELPVATESEIKDFADLHQVHGFYPIIGMATRFASEKGVEVLLNALPQVLQAFPEAKVLYAGTYQHVMGEETYFNRLYPMIQAYEAKGQWKFLGNLNPQEMAAFYPNLDTLVVPSLNSTESFGLVQIEAMINGAPCVASELPGVRQPVLQHGMGKVIPIGDSSALAQAIIEIAKNKEAYITNPRAIMAQYAPGATAAAYEDLFVTLLESMNKR